MPKTYCPTGFLKMGKQSITDDKYIEILQDMNPVTTQVLDGVATAKRVRDETGIPYVLHRTFSQKAPETWWTQSQVMALAHTAYNDRKKELVEGGAQGDTTIHQQILCEQGFNDNIFLFCETLMKLSAAEGQYGLAFIFINPAFYSNGYWSGRDDGYTYHPDLNAWNTPGAHSYMRTFHNYRNLRTARGTLRFLHGHHNYHDGYPNCGINAGYHVGDGQQRGWLDWDLKLDMSVPQDYIMRYEQAAFNALNYRWVKPGGYYEATAQTPRGDDGRHIMPPRAIASEAGIDAMGLLWMVIDSTTGRRYQTDIIVRPPWNAPSGWNFWYETWKQPGWYPDMEPGEVYGKMASWRDKVCYQATGITLSEIVYAAGNTGTKVQENYPYGWTPHTLLGREAYHPDGYFLNESQMNQHWIDAAKAYQRAYPDFWFDKNIPVPEVPLKPSAPPVEPPPVVIVGLPPALSSTRWKPIRLNAVNADGANVRNGPLTNASIVASVPKTGTDGYYLPKADMTEQEILKSTDTGGKYWHSVKVWFSNQWRTGFARKDVITLTAGSPVTGLIDVVPYLKGSNRLYSLNSNELVQSQLLDGKINHWRQVKNANWEELAYDNQYIYRGTDTSPNENEYYVLLVDGKRGAPWCPRYWEPGKPFRRSNEVRFFSKKTGQPSRHPYTDTSYLEMVAYWPTLTFPSGITLPDVIELVWYYDAAAKPEEHYFYAANYGLVAWGSTNGGFRTYISHEWDASGQGPKPNNNWPGVQYMATPSLDAPPPQPEPEPEPDPDGIFVSAVDAAKLHELEMKAVAANAALSNHIDKLLD